jgi:hypothetical protein
MNMDTQIRVKTDSRYARLYADLKNQVARDFHELFYVCAALGFMRRSRKPLGKSGEDRFWSSTIEPLEWTCYYAMLLDANGMDFAVIRDDREVIAVIEEYANAGMEILVEQFLGNYTVAKGPILMLDGASTKELPKDFLHYLYEQADVGSCDASR